VKKDKEMRIRAWFLVAICLVATSIVWIVLFVLPSDQNPDGTNSVTTSQRLGVRTGNSVTCVVGEICTTPGQFCLRGSSETLVCDTESRKFRPAKAEESALTPKEKP